MDDFGYNDLGANGNTEVPTKNLNNLAHKGVRFTRHYADSTCSPSRTAILTGKLPSHTAQPIHFIGISPEVQTLPETLQQAGYKTYHIGKWHVGDSIKGAWPSSQGFDHWFGFLNQFLLQNTGDPEQPYSKPSYINPWLQSDKTPRQAYQGHLTDILTEHTVETIETLSNSNEPWFINLWYFAPHDPIQPAKRYSIRYPDTKKGKYYALLEQLDESIGQVLDTLDKFNLTENTIVVLLSDNGGTNHATNNNFPFFGKKATFYEGGVRTPLLISWPGKIAQDKVINNIVSEVDIFPTLSHIAHATTSPTDLDGINLFQHYLSTKPDIVNTLSMRPLFWEIAWEKYYAFSVLSADGKWRVMNKKLFNLEEDYTGSTNVANEHPEVLKKLTNQFFNWQKNATKAEVQFKRSNESTGILIGDSYHRAPADGGFTFSIALKPSNTDINKQTIIEHLGLWSIKHNDKKIEVTIGDVQLSAPSLEINKCSTISVSTYFDATKKSPENRKASYQLYINGKLVTEKEKRLYKNLQDRYLGTTKIGWGKTGYNFKGVISSPSIYNTYLGMNISKVSSSGLLPESTLPLSKKIILDEIYHQGCLEIQQIESRRTGSAGSFLNSISLFILILSFYLAYSKKGGLNMN